MGRLNSSSTLECEVGGVCHMCYFNTSEIEEIINRKGKENVPLNGQIFPYIAHYLTTGDLIYPAHEGENYISSLLREMGRLDLVRKLFPNQMNGKTSHSGLLRTSDKNKSQKDSSATIRIRTRDERWFPKALSRWLRLPKSANSKTPQVYRPPSQQNKGTTLVLIRSSLHGSNHIRIHGPSTALKSLIPDALTITTQPTHHHLNSQLEPHGSSAHSIVMNLEDQGFVVTVRSSRVEGKTGAVITQWLLYRGSGKKLTSSSGTTSKRTPSIGRALVSRKTRSFNSSRKKIVKSTSRCRRKPFSFGTDAAKYKTEVNKNQEIDGETISSQEVDDDKRRINLNKYFSKSHNSHLLISPSSSQSSTSTISSTASNSKDSSYISASSFSSSSSSSSASPSSSSSSFSSTNFSEQQQNKLAKEQEETTSVKDRLWNRKLSSQSFQENVSMTRPKSILKSSPKSSLKSHEESNLTNGHKSLSTSTIAPKPAKKIMASVSLWNICSKSPIKKVLTILR